MDSGGGFEEVHFPMNEVFPFGLLVLASFFTLVNPLGVMPIFMSLTSGMPQRDRVSVARKACIVSAITIVVFAFMGEFIFSFFNITIHSFRIVGGVVFFLMGLDMLQARIARSSSAETNLRDEVDDISVTPLAIPMICGPGALTNAILLMNDASTGVMKLTLVVGVGIVMSATFLILYGASRIMKLFGRTGINVMMRLMGLIVMVIAVEFFFAGLLPLI